MPITLKDIAREAGTSQQVASAVLNGARGTAGASLAVRRRIEDSATRLGYRPNLAARATATGRYNAVGLLLGTVEHNSMISEPLLMAVADALSDQGMHLTAARMSDRELTDDTRMSKILRHLMADGLLIKYDTQVPAQMFELLKRFRIPCVWVNSRKSADCVYPDDFAAAERLTEHLLKLGHRRIAYLDYVTSWGGAHSHYSGAARRDGYLRTMGLAGLEPVLITPGPLVAQGKLAEAFGELIASMRRENRLPTAFITYSSDQANTLAYAAAGQGLRIPVDVSLAAFSGMSYERFGQTLTTCLIPWAGLAQQSVDMIRRKIARPDELAPPVSISFDFEPGGTAGPPP